MFLFIFSFSQSDMKNQPFSKYVLRRHKPLKNRKEIHIPPIFSAKIFVKTKVRCSTLILALFKLLLSFHSKTKGEKETKIRSFVIKHTSSFLSLSYFFSFLLCAIFIYSRKKRKRIPIIFREFSSPHTVEIRKKTSRHCKISTTKQNM